MGRSSEGVMRVCAIGWALLTAVAGGTGCTGEPRHGDVIDDFDQTFSGWYPVADQALAIQARENGTYRWVTLARTTTSSDADYTDDCGVSWFPFSARVALPGMDQPKFWSPILGTYPTFSIYTRVYAAGFTLGSHPLYSFRESSAACIEAHSGECGVDIAKACGDEDGEIGLVYHW